MLGGVAGSRDRPPGIPDLDLPPSKPAISAAPRLGPPAKGVVEDIGDFDMEIERGGALITAQPAVSGRRAQSRPDASGLDVAYRRSDLEARAPVNIGPSFKEKLVAHSVAGVSCAATFALLVKLLHRPGGLPILGVLPRAFDASSTLQSGAFALVSLVVAIALGYVGVKAEPRSYATIASGGMALLASLAMITVTLVSTDEHPAPPDGALLIPYVVPLGILLLALGAVGWAVRLFLKGGGKRAMGAAVGIGSGALIFLATELSVASTYLR